MFEVWQTFCEYRDVIGFDIKITKYHMDILQMACMKHLKDISFSLKNRGQFSELWTLPVHHLKKQMHINQNMIKILNLL